MTETLDSVSRVARPPRLGGCETATAARLASFIARTCHTILYHAMLYYTILYHTIPYYTRLSYIILY